MAQVSSNMLLPSFLGSGKSKYEVVLTKPKTEDLAQIAQWTHDDLVKCVIGSVFKVDDVLKAFAKLKTSRAKGEVIVHVKPEMKEYI